MIYGQVAKTYSGPNQGGGDFNIVSESDAIMDYLMNEANQYEEIIMNESFLDEQSRLIMEAKLTAIHEAVSGAIIAAIVAILTAIIALIAKFIKMMKDGQTKIKFKFGKGSSESNSKDLTEEQEKELNSKIEALISSLNYSNKEKLKNYSDNDITDSRVIRVGKSLFKDILSWFKSLSSIDKSVDADKAKSIIEPVYNNIQSIKSEFDQANLKSESFEGDNNLFFDVFVLSSVHGGPVAARRYAKAFISSGYYDKTVKIQDQITKEVDETKKFLDGNSKKLLSAVHPDNHGSKAEFNNVFSMLNNTFKTIKEYTSLFRTMMAKWAEAEKFRLSYCNIVAQYC